MRLHLVVLCVIIWVLVISPGPSTKFSVQFIMCQYLNFIGIGHVVPVDYYTLLRHLGYQLACDLFDLLDTAGAYFRSMW